MSFKSKASKIIIWLPVYVSLSLLAIFSSSASLRASEVSNTPKAQVAGTNPPASPSNTPPLSTRATAQEIWIRMQEVLRLPHGLVTVDNFDRVFGEHMDYVSNDAAGYMSRSSNKKNKNYIASLIYLYRATDKKMLMGPESTLSVQLPTSDCLTTDQVEGDMFSLGMHFLAERSPPLPPSKIYSYVDGNGDIEVFYRNSEGPASSVLKNACVINLTLHGYVKSGSH